MKKSPNFFFSGAVFDWPGTYAAILGPSRDAARQTLPKRPPIIAATEASKQDKTSHMLSRIELIGAFHGVSSSQYSSIRY